MLFCYVSEFRVAHFFSLSSWVCSFHNLFLCCSVMCLYVLSSVLLISLVFVLSCFVSLCSKFRVAHFIIFFALSCYISLCSEFRVSHFIIFLYCPVMCLPCCSCFFVLSCYVSLNSVLLISLCCPVMHLYVLSSVLLISLVFFVVLLCVCMFWVPCCSFL